ncbi:MAG: DUF4350 domain-containing protein [Erythrobacter sp.]
MPLRNRGVCAALAAAVLVLLPACDAAPQQAAEATVTIGLMSSLPLTFPLGADIAAIANGSVPVPWQRAALGADYRIEPLDTLSPTPALSADAVALDPLAGLTRLAVIQPRGLSPTDNVALDNWVRGGGRLLLALDPALTGMYDLSLGDPRRPVESALIPPVVERWGLAIRFDEEQTEALTSASLGETTLPLVLSGTVVITDPAAGQCTLDAGGAAARCRIGQGHVTLIADAAIFEDEELAGQGGKALRAVVAEAFK